MRRMLRADMGGISKYKMQRTNDKMREKSREGNLATRWRGWLSTSAQEIARFALHLRHNLNKFRSVSYVYLCVLSLTPSSCPLLPLFATLLPVPRRSSRTFRPDMMSTSRGCGNLV